MAVAKSLVMPNGVEFEFVGVAWFLTCSTPATTRDKTLSSNIPMNTRDPVNGMRIRVRFDNAQSYDGQPRLVFAGVSANIYYADGTQAGLNAWKAGEIVDFTRYSNAWYMNKLPMTIYDGSVT